MEAGPERWELRWELCGATGREKWRLRRRLWIAMVGVWLYELRIRICLVRYCVAIYRREVWAHRRETVGMEVEFLAKKRTSGPDC